MSATLLTAPRAPEVTDEMRAEAIAACLKHAATVCELRDEWTLDDLLRAAPGFGLEPRLYQLAWMLRKWEASNCR